MSKTYIQNEYFNWLMLLITEDYPVEIHRYEIYLSLLRHLHKVEFVWSNPMDVNRAKDGQNLRLIFASEGGYDEYECENELNGPCSMLEMMLGLAYRCEREIMYNPREGDRTSLWFWQMINSLGLENMDCLGYDSDKIDEILNDFMCCRYGRDGKGGLFYIPNFPKNLKNFEIWYQMQWYLEANF